MDTTKAPLGPPKTDFLSFNPLDYVMFVGLLLISTIIGIYFGLYKKQKTVNDYLLGGKKMKIIPVAISLAASYTSAITLLGMPAEIYKYGTQYLVSCLATLSTSFIVAKIFLPVFYELQVASSFEYLSLRFNNSVRRTASFITLLSYMFTMPLVMYVPALAFNLVSGVDIKYITPAICCICVFYTAIGGLKAVVWTDAIQFVIMNGSIFAIILMGIPNEGGISKIWSIGEETDRIHFINLDPSPFTRMTFWSIFFGMGVTWISALGVNQMCVQRFMSLPSMADATKVLYMYCVMVVTMKALCLLSGLIMVARYFGCDPFHAGQIQKLDQILPYYVLDTARNLRGLPGIFIAGVFSAALSSMSTYLNTSCGIVYNDFVVPLVPMKLSDEAGSKIMKIIAVVLGSICTVLVMYIDKFGNILQLSISIEGTTCGAMLGTFVLGMVVPRGNVKGAIAGALTSMGIVLCVVYNNNLAMSNNIIQYPTKKLTTERCDFDTSNSSIFDLPTTTEAAPMDDDIFPLFKISFTWYSFIGFTTMLLVAIPVSYLTEPPSPKQAKPEHFSPFLRKYLTKTTKESVKTNTECNYEKVELNILNDKN